MAKKRGGKKADRRVGKSAAMRALEAGGVSYEVMLYAYEERGGTRVSARELGVDEHAVVKTLVMEDEGRRPLVVLMHGDRKVSTRALARQLGVKSVRPCAPEVANKHSGYVVGGTSPFGTRRVMPVYVEASILELPEIYINGGGRGTLVRVDPRAALALVDAKPVEVAIEG